MSRRESASEETVATGGAAASCGDLEGSRGRRAAALRSRSGGRSASEERLRGSAGGGPEMAGEAACSSAEGGEVAPEKVACPRLLEVSGPPPLAPEGWSKGVERRPRPRRTTTKTSAPSPGPGSPVTSRPSLEEVRGGCPPTEEGGGGDGGRRDSHHSHHHHHHYSLPQSGVAVPATGGRLPQEPPTRRDGRVNAVTTTTTTTTTPAVGRNIGRILELAVLLLALIFATPADGRYDRGGPQHSITWGRSNAHNSAVFGSLPTNITAVLGHRARLPCQVKNLGLKDVSWIRKRDLHILTVGIFTYTADERFKVFHQVDTEDWFLEISSVTFRDAGVYECQVSTSPKVSLPIHLTVLAVQEAEVLGPSEVYIQHGSTISLQCEVEAGTEAVGPVLWFRGDSALNYSSPRGGISMEVEKTPSRTMSKLYITRAVRPDSGNYTCAPKFARPDSVIVHVVNAGEESAAAVQSGSEGSRACVGAVWAASFLTTWLVTPTNNLLLLLP